MSDSHETAFEREIWGGPVANPPRGMIPARTRIDGVHVSLEPLDPAAHTSALYAASHADEDARAIWTYLPWGPWDSEAAFRAHIDGCAASFDYIWYVFRLRDRGLDGGASGGAFGGGGSDRRGDGGQIKGMACFLDVQPGPGVIEIGGIWFAPAMQRTRAATEALFLMLDYAMTDLRYRRMQWRCNALNAKSRAAARRLGYTHEGIFYNHMIVKGRNRDTAWYSLLDTDWPDIRGIIRAWLADDNFDTDGVAKTSLTARMAARAVAPRG